MIVVAVVVEVLAVVLVIDRSVLYVVMKPMPLMLEGIPGHTKVIVAVVVIVVIIDISVL